jgi:hypothetical protein
MPRNVADGSGTGHDKDDFRSDKARGGGEMKESEGGESD